MTAAMNTSRRHVSTIADTLQEPNVDLVRRVVRVLGETCTHALLAETLKIEAEGGLLIADKSRQAHAWGHVLSCGEVDHPAETPRAHLSTHGDQPEGGLSAVLHMERRAGGDSISRRHNTRRGSHRETDTHRSTNSHADARTSRDLSADRKASRHGGEGVATAATPAAHCVDRDGRLATMEPGQRQPGGASRRYTRD